MSDPLSRWKEYGLSEAYEIVRTVEVVMDDHRYRIEVVKSHWNSNMPFTTREYVAEDVMMTRESPEGAKPEPMQVWVDCGEAPWTAGNDPDAALAQALGFLADRKRRSRS
jgi:hypothetical protein